MIATQLKGKLLLFKDTYIQYYIKHITCSPTINTGPA